MADPKFDPSNVDHVEALAKRLGRAPVKWYVREGYGGGFADILGVRFADWKYSELWTPSQNDPRFSEYVRREDRQRLARAAVDMLLADVVACGAVPG